MIRCGEGRMAQTELTVVMAQMGSRGVLALQAAGLFPEMDKMASLASTVVEAVGAVAAAPWGAYHMMFYVFR